MNLDRGMAWEQAIAELNAANAREAASGNTNHISGFYEERFSTISGGRKRQYLVIRRVYQ